MAARKMAKVNAGNAHNDLIDPTANIACDYTQGRADDASEDNRGEADNHRHPGAEDEPRQHIPSQLICAKQITGTSSRLPNWRTEPRGQAANLRIVRRQ